MEATELCSGDSLYERKPTGSGGCWQRFCPTVVERRCSDGGGSFRRAETARTESDPAYSPTRSMRWKWRNVARTISATEAIPNVAVVDVDSMLSVGKDCGYFRGHVPAVAQSRISQRFSGTPSATGLEPGAFWTDRNTYTSGGFAAAAAGVVAVA